MNLFDHFARAAKAPATAIYATPVRIVPTISQASPNAAGRRLDPERPVFRTSARFFMPIESLTDTDDARRDVMRSGPGDRALHTRSRISATIDDPKHQPRPADMVERLTDHAVFSITETVPDGTGSFVLHLAPADDVPGA